MLGLYIHIPFCVRKCIYCDFYSIPCGINFLKIKNDYISAITEDIYSYKGRGLTADTLYFGGGTPSLLECSDFDRIISACREVFALDGEITSEANPSSVDEEYLSGLYRAGVNRISFGIQSLFDGELSALSRLHDSKTAKNAVISAYNAGFRDISADLMLGTPNQTRETALESVKQLSELPLVHISAYMLKVEPATPLSASPLLSQLADEDALCDIYLSCADKLECQGFVQYEISNFARNSRKSLHNLKYWRCEEYLGFGASAHSFFNGVRYKNAESVENYIRCKGSNPIVTDKNGGTPSEKIMLGLRLNEGVPFSFFDSFSSEELEYINNKISYFESLHLLRKTKDRISLTSKGFLVSNYIIANITP